MSCLIRHLRTFGRHESQRPLRCNQDSLEGSIIVSEYPLQLCQITQISDNIYELSLENYCFDANMMQPCVKQIENESIT